MKTVDEWVDEYQYTDLSLPSEIKDLVIHIQMDAYIQGLRDAIEAVEFLKTKGK